MVYMSFAPSEKDVETSSLLQIVTRRNTVELREKVVLGAVYAAASGEASQLTCRITTPTGKALVFPMLAGTLGSDVGLSRPLAGQRCYFTPNEAGRYDIVMTTADGTQSAELTLLAAEPQLETTREPLGRDYLDDVAQQTGGRFVPWADRFRMFQDLPHETQAFTRTSEVSIWDRWWWIGVILTLFCSEWWWRRKLDLV